MNTPYRHCALFVLALLISAGIQAQNNYLLSHEHKTKGGSENTYFYLEQLNALPPMGLPAAKIMTVDGRTYRVNYIRLREEAPSWYVGCSMYGSQARGEELSLNQLLRDSVIRTHDQRQQAIEAQCNSLFSNKGKQNSLLTADVNAEDKVKLIKIDFEYCSCVTGRQQFSHLADSLIMPRKVIKSNTFTEEEKTYWQAQIPAVLQNEFVKSCLPNRERDFSAYQAGRE